MRLQTSALKSSFVQDLSWACPVMIKRAESVTAVSRVCPAKKNERGLQDRERQSEERNRDKTKFNGETEPSCCRTKRRAKRDGTKRRNQAENRPSVGLCMTNVSVVRR